MVFPFIAAAFTAVTSALASIGPVMATFATNVLPTLAPYLAKGLEVMTNVARVAEVVAQILGVFRPGETATDMGERALQAAEKGITPQGFDNHDEYMNALRKFQLDPEKQHDPIATLISGLAVVSVGMDAKLDLPDGTSGNLWQLVAADGNYFTADKILNLVQTGQNLTDVVSYFTGKLGGAEALQTENQLLKLDKANHPDTNENSLRERMYSAQERVQAGADAM